MFTGPIMRYSILLLTVCCCLLQLLSVTIVVVCYNCCCLLFFFHCLLFLSHCLLSHALLCPAFRLGYARVSHGGLSDTEVQIGKFRLPDYDGEPDNDRMTHDAQDVPEWTHFPDM